MATFCGLKCLMIGGLFLWCDLSMSSIMLLARFLSIMGMSYWNQVPTAHLIGNQWTSIGFWSPNLGDTQGYSIRSFVYSKNLFQARNYQWSQSHPKNVRTLAVGKLCRKASQRQLVEPHPSAPLLRWAYGASMAATCWTRDVQRRRPWCYGRWSKRIHTRPGPWTIWRWLSIAKGVCMLLLILGVGN